MSGRGSSSTLVPHMPASAEGHRGAAHQPSELLPPQGSHGLPTCMAQPDARGRSHQPAALEGLQAWPGSLQLALCQETFVFSLSAEIVAFLRSTQKGAEDGQSVKTQMLQTGNTSGSERSAGTL